MNEYLDFNLIPLGFQKNNAIQEAIDKFCDIAATDKKFKFLFSPYRMKPHSKLITSCCNKLVELNSDLPRAILLHYQDYTISKDILLNLIKYYPHQGCGCDLLNVCLLENDVSNFRKYYQVENCKFYLDDSEGNLLESGLVMYSKKILRESDDFEQSIFTLKEGKLDGPFIRYLFFSADAWYWDIQYFIDEEHNLFVEQLKEVRGSFEEFKLWKRILVQYLKLPKLPIQDDPENLVIRTPLSLYRVLLDSLIRETIKAFLDQDSISNFYAFVHKKHYKFVIEQGFFQNNKLNGKCRALNEAKGFSNEVITKNFLNGKELDIIQLNYQINDKELFNATGL